MNKQFWISGFLCLAFFPLLLQSAVEKPEPERADRAEPNNSTRDFESKALKLARNIATTSQKEIRPLFDELTHLLNESADVVPLIQKVYGGLSPEDSAGSEIARGVIRDALVTCNTVACMKGVRYLALNNHLSNDSFNEMLYGLTKLRITDPAYIDEIFDICKEKPTRMCLLSLTSVIYTNQHKNKDIAPSQAFRHFSTHPQVNKLIFETIFNDTELRIEDRIAAYLVLVGQSDDPQLFEQIAEVLGQEKDHQLANFITMHMTNVQWYGDAGLETCRLKTNMSTAMNNHPTVFIVRGARSFTFPHHRERASFNYREDISERLGIDVSSSAIYETFSYLPQNVILNLTTQLFSKTFNPI